VETTVSAEPEDEPEEADPENDDDPDEEDEETDDEEDEPDEEGVRVRTSPSRARIYVNGRYAGTSPLLLDLSPGRHRITAERSGYYGETVSVRHEDGEYQEVRVTLEEITGTLLVDADPPDAEIRVNGERLSAGVPHELPIGSQTVEVRSFGYETERVTTRIRENRRTTLRVALDEAPFRFEDLTVSPRVFSPEDPGSHGRIRAESTVSAPGEGRYRILDAGGDQVAGPFPVRFTERRHRLTWDGRDDDGTPLPDGSYRLVVEGEEGHVERRDFSIDRSITRRVRPVYGGSAGTLFAPLPGAMPRGGIQVGGIGLGYYDGDRLLLPLAASLRYSPTDRTETTFSGGAIVRSVREADDDPPSIPFGSISWSRRLFRAGDRADYGVETAGSLLLRGSYYHRSVLDPLLADTGVAAALPLSLEIGPVTLAVTPELAARPVPAAVWGYARAAGVLDVGSVSLAASAALRTTPLDQGIAPEWPAAGGLELHWLIPDTPVTVTGAGTLHWHPQDGWYAQSGAGLWVAF